MRRDPFGHRLDPPNPASLCADLAGRLRAIADGPDTPAARAEVEAALGSKWWGVRVLAIRAIGRWRTERDRAWLVERARRLSPTRADREASGDRHGLRWLELEAREALHTLFRRAPRPEDAGWLLDLWFAGPVGRIGAGWLAVVPEAALRERVAAEIRDGNPDRRQRAIWLLFLTDRIANRAEILGLLTASADEAAARLAADLLGRLERPRPSPAAPHRPLRSPPTRRRPPPR